MHAVWKHAEQDTVSRISHDHDHHADQQMVASCSLSSFGGLIMVKCHLNYVNQVDLGFEPKCSKQNAMFYQPAILGSATNSLHCILQYVLDAVSQCLDSGFLLAHTSHQDLDRFERGFLWSSAACVILLSCLPW